MRLFAPLTPADIASFFTDSEGILHDHKAMTCTCKAYVDSKQSIRYDPDKRGRKFTRFVYWLKLPRRLGRTAGTPTGPDSGYGCDGET